MPATDTKAVLTMFNNWDQNTAAVNSAGRWFPPTGDYALELTGLLTDTFTWTDKATKRELSKPKLIFKWRVLEGEYAGRQFDEEYLINQKGDAPNAKANEMADKEMGRLRGTLEVATGQSLPDGLGGFGFLASTLIGLLDQGPIAISANVYNHAYEKQVGDTKQTRYIRNVTSRELLDVSSN